MVNPKFFYITVNTINVGRGAAICLNIGLNRKGEDKVTHPLFLGVNKNITIRIFAFDDIESIKGEYELLFNMNDIYGNNYRQTFRLFVDDAGKPWLSAVSDDFFEDSKDVKPMDTLLESD